MISEVKFPKLYHVLGPDPLLHFFSENTFINRPGMVLTASLCITARALSLDEWMSPAGQILTKVTHSVKKTKTRLLKRGGGLGGGVV